MKRTKRFELRKREPVQPSEADELAELNLDNAAWIPSSGTWCSYVFGAGKRISLKGINKYPAPEYWREPEKSYFLYQRSKGRGGIYTVCYSNLYPSEHKNRIEEEARNAIERMGKMLGKKIVYEDIGMNEDLREFLNNLSAGVVMDLEELTAWYDELRRMTPLERLARRRSMQGLGRRLRIERANASPARLAIKEFNSKTSARRIEILRGARLKAYNKRGFDITELYDRVLDIESGR